MKKNTLITVIPVVAAAIFLVSLLAGAVGVGFTVIANKPENVAATALRGTIEGLTERQEIKPLKNTFTKGSVAVNASDITCDGEDMLDGLEVAGKVYFSRDDKALMFEDLMIKREANKIQGSLYASTEVIYVSEEEILGDGYGVDLGGLAEDFRDSIFAYGSGSDYSIDDKEAFDFIMDLLECSDQMTEIANNEKMQKDAEKVAKELYTQIWKIAGENFDFTSENDEVRIDGTRENVRVVTIVVDGESLACFVNDVYEFMANDDSMIKHLENYEEEYSSIRDMYFTVCSAYIDSNSVGYNIEPAFSWLDQDMSVAELYENALEEVGKNIDEICDEIEAEMNEDLTIKIITPRFSSKLVKLEILVGEEMFFALETGMDGIKKTDKIAVSVYEETVVYKIEENSRTRFFCYLEYEDSRVEIKINRAKGNYVLQFVDSEDSDEESCIAKGAFIKNGNTTKITVDKVTFKASYQDDIVYKCNISVELDQNDKIPAAPKGFKTIADITEKDVKKWQERIENSN